MSGDKTKRRDGSKYIYSDGSNIKWGKEWFFGPPPSTFHSNKATNPTTEHEIFNYFWRTSFNRINNRIKFQKFNKDGEPIIQYDRNGIPMELLTKAQKQEKKDEEERRQELAPRYANRYRNLSHTCHIR